MTGPGFSNSIFAGNGTLLTAAAQSPNYVPGVSGWQIRKDGTVEFQGATIRGTVVIAGSNALLVYNGTPALGNLIFSVASTAGTDALGNTYPAGIGLPEVTVAGAPGSIAWSINKTGAQSFISQVNPGSGSGLTIAGPASGANLAMFATGEAQYNCNTNMYLVPAQNLFLGSRGATGFGIEQHGHFNAAFAAVAAVVGTLTFPVGFTVTPTLCNAVQVGANLDIMINWVNVTTTSATWRAVTRNGSAVTGTAIIHWWGVG